jgi:hypothetical protein
MSRLPPTSHGSQWDILAHVVSGRLSGRQLAPIQHTNHFWFAWAAFKPQR